MHYRADVIAQLIFHVLLNITMFCSSSSNTHIMCLINFTIFWKVKRYRKLLQV